MHSPPAESVPCDSEPVIDLAHLQSFTDGDPQLENELLSLFLSTAEAYLARMSQALEAGEALERDCPRPQGRQRQPWCTSGHGAGSRRRAHGGQRGPARSAAQGDRGGSGAGARTAALSATSGADPGRRASDLASADNLLDLRVHFACYPCGSVGKRTGCGRDAAPRIDARAMSKEPGRKCAEPSI